MEKFFLQLSDSEQYSDNRLGRIIYDMLVHSHHDLVVFFREHVAIISFNKEKQVFDLTIGKDLSSSLNEEQIVLIEKIKEFEVDCQKWVPYHLMKEMREQYPELNNVNFPVEDFRFWFTCALSWVFYLNEDFVIENNKAVFIEEES